MPPLYKQGKSQTQPIREFAPDADVRTPGILLDCWNAVPSLSGFRARRSPVLMCPQALPGVPIGAYLAQYSDDSLALWVGTPQHLYRWDGAVWTQVDTTGGFAIPASAVNTYPRWRFAQFLDEVIAVNSAVAAPLVEFGATGTFAPLGGTPPSNLATIISVGGVVVGYKNSSWFSSAAGTDNNWTPDIQTQAATGTLYDYPGTIVAGSPFFRTQVVWKAASMYILTYIGADVIWQNQLASNATGTWGQECVVQGPEAIYFIGSDDFYVTQGYAPQRIPNQLKEWFFRTVYRDVNQNPIFLDQTWSWYDPVNSVVYWHFVSKTAPFIDPAPDRYISYNVRSRRWGAGYLNTRCVVPNTQPGSGVLQAGRMSGLYFDTNNFLLSWIGDPTTMGLLTGYYGDESRLSQMLRVRATYTDGLYPTSDSIVPLHTYILGKGPTVGPPYIKGQDDWFNGRNYDRYHSFHISTVGDTEIVGFAAESRVGGNR